MKVGAVLLAAGGSKRFGSDKLLQLVEGEPLILRSLRALDGLERVVVVGARYQDIMRYLEGEVVIYNPRWSEGLSTSVKLGLRFFCSYDAVVFHLADMPLVTKDTITKLLQNVKDECDAVVPIHAGKRGNPVMITKRIFPLAENIKGDVGFREILAQVRACEVDAGPEVLIDIDTPDDLSKLSSFRSRP
ncbi:MAG: nucleotidyltransferase family protein [Thermoprotei archaeon]